MSEPISYVGKEAAKRIVSKAKEKFSPIEHKHSKSDITDLIIDSELSSTSTNPVQNKIVFNAIERSTGELSEDIKNRKFYINITNNNGTFSADKTIAEIDEAYADGKFLYCVFEEEIIGNMVLGIPEIGYAFSITLPIDEYCNCVLILVTTDGVDVTERELALKSDIPEIDTALNATSDNAISNSAVYNAITSYNNLLLKLGSKALEAKSSNSLPSPIYSSYLFNEDMGYYYSPKTFYTDVIKKDGTSYFDGYEQVTAAEKAEWNAKSEFGGKFADLSNKPTTLSGYGITDGATKGELNSVQEDLEKHANKNDVHFSSSERTKLSGIESGAQKNTITGIKGSSEQSYRTGQVNIAKENIGLDNVDNTSDANKPVSTKQAEAINKALVDANGYTDEKIALLLNNSSEAVDSIMELAIAMEENDDVVEALEKAVGNKADKTHSHNGGDITINSPFENSNESQLDVVLENFDACITGLKNNLNGKANTSHAHKTSDITYDGESGNIVGNGNTLNAIIQNYDQKMMGVESGVTNSSNHIKDSTIHVTQYEKDSWYDKADKNHTHSYDLSDIASTNAPWEYISGNTAEDMFMDVDTKLYELNNTKADNSHGNHVPAIEIANNAKFLRNDNTWQTVTPANIGAAEVSHGTHVSYSATSPVMDGSTASVGSASTVARSDHKHPTDTSRASSVEFNEHKSDTISHITSSERTKWDATKVALDELSSEVIRATNEGDAYVSDGSPVKNEIAISTDINGNLFVGDNGEVGYKNGYRWSSSNKVETKEPTQGITGFIPCKHGDTLRLKNVSMNVSYPYIVYFDSSKKVLGTINVGGSTDPNGVITTTLSAHSNVGFIRLALGLFTPDSLATINYDFTLSGTVQVGWIVDKDNNKIVPKTLASQVVRPNGTNIENYIDSSIAQSLDEANAYTDEQIANISIDIDSSLSTTSTNPVENKAVTNWLAENVKNYQLIHDYGNGNTYLSNSNVSTIATEPSDGTTYIPEVHMIDGRYLSPEWNYVRNKTSATTNVAGIVQLTNSTSSTSTTTAATPSSVKSAYDLANTAKTKADSAYSLAESKVDSLSDLGITATATELNYMDGVTSSVQAQLDGKAEKSHGTHVSYGTSATSIGASASAGSATTVSRSDHTHSLSKSAVTTALGYTPPTKDTTYGVATSSALGLVKSGTDITVDSSGNVSVNNNSHTHTVSNISDLTATAAELNKLDGVTATTAEINYLDGVTSAIQAQIDGKAASSHNHSASNITSGTLSSDRLSTVPLTKGGTGINMTKTANAIIRFSSSGDYFSNTATSNGAFFATSSNGTPKFGTLPIEQGGTGATSSSAARANLGATKVSIVRWS